MPRKGIYSDVTFLTLPCCSWLHAGRQFREPFLAFAYNWEKGEDRNHELKRSSDERRSILHGLISAHEGKTTIWTNMCWGISAGSDCVHTIWEWSLANGMVVLAFVINVSVEKFKMRSMCFSFASVLKCARQLRMRCRDLFERMFKTLRVFAPSSSEFIPFLTCHHSITDFEINAFLNQDSSYRLLKFVSDLVSIFDTGWFCFTSQLPSARDSGCRPSL